MLAKKSNGASYPDLDTAVHQGVLQPLGTLIAVMNELSMAAKRMAQQQNHSRRHEEQDKCRERKRQRTPDQYSRQHSKKPDGLDRGVPHMPRTDRIQIRYRDSVGFQAGGQRYHWISIRRSGGASQGPGILV